MRFRYNQTIERTICPKTVAVENSPAWLIICLIKSLNDWLGLPHRVFYRHGDRQLKIGYEVLSFPTDELAENFGSLVSKIDQTWPLEVFGIADSGELIGISFAGDGDSLVMRQQSVSGVWFDELRDLYLTCSGRLRTDAPQRQWNGSTPIFSNSSIWPVLTARCPSATFILNKTARMMLP